MLSMKRLLLLIEFMAPKNRRKDVNDSILLL